MRETDPGRYGLKRSPSVELPPAGDYGHVRIKHGSVDDPNPIFRGQKQLAAVNVATDALEAEYAAGRIDEAQYRAGLVYQAVLERQYGRSASAIWSDVRGGDRGQVRDDRIVRALEDAKRAAEFLDDCRQVIGMQAEWMLVRTLGHRDTLVTITHLIFGSTHWRLRRDVGRRFGTALTQLADHWSARGVA